MSSQTPQEQPDEVISLEDDSPQAAATAVEEADSSAENPAEVDQDLYLWDARPAGRARLLAWVIPTVITLVAFVARLHNLGKVKELIFDETYYVKDAVALMANGYEAEWPKHYNEIFQSGNYDIPTDPSFVVHPEFGKWLIAAGIKLFGDNPFGWRFAVCLFGTAAILVTARIAWHLFGSWQLASVAAAFMALDGQQVVMSRVAILDGLLQFWILVGIWAILRDQMQTRPVLIKRIFTPPPAPPDKPSPESGKAAAPPGLKQKLAGFKAGYERIFGPSAGWRPWLVVAGIALGLASGVKWSGLYVVAAGGLFVFFREVSARWNTTRTPLRGAIMRGGIPAFFALVPTAVITYIATWASWIVHMEGWGHKTGHTSFFARLGDLWDYHVQAYNFHVGLHTPHSYQSNPLGWLLQLRPTSFHYKDVPADTCGADRCAEAITALGNPLLWWLGIIGLILVLWGLIRGDWRAGFIFLGYAATYLPWLNYINRTIFTFYTVVIVPFVVLALTYVIGITLGMTQVRKEPYWAASAKLTYRRLHVPKWSQAIGITVIVAVIVTGLFFYPIWVAADIPFTGWQHRMWLTSWV